MAKPQLMQTGDRVNERQEKWTRLLPFEASAVLHQKALQCDAGNGLCHRIGRAVFFKNGGHRQQRGQRASDQGAVELQKVHQPVIEKEFAVLRD